MRDLINIVENALRSAPIKGIDIDGAIRHFDMPVDLKPSEMKAAFAETKRQFIAMFKGQKRITIYRGLRVTENWKPKNGLGRSWAFAEEGAMKGSGLAYWKPEHKGELGVMLFGEVSIDSVDWLTTIAVNAFHEDEQEIVLKPGAPIMLNMVCEADRFGVDSEYGVLMHPKMEFTA